VTTSKTDPKYAAISSTGAGQLVDVSSKLAEMVAALQRSRESVAARSSAPAAPAQPAVTPLPGTLPAVLKGAEALRPAGDESTLRERLKELESANRQVGDELTGLQAQIAHTVAMSVTLRRLHESSDQAEVLEALGEAVVNILGCENWVILLAEGDVLRPARLMGLAPWRADQLAASTASATAAGKVLSGREVRAVDLSLTALVPLAARGRTVGAIALQALLPHRGDLGPLDAEVMELLGLHGALAYLAAPPAVRG
jgi:hypothetical protein